MPGLRSSLLLGLTLLFAGCPQDPVEEELPGITTTSLADGYVGEPYSATLAVEGGHQPYTWTSAAQALPPGLTLRASGQLNGTPSEAGEFSAAVNVVDSEGQTDGQSVGLTVYAPLAFAVASLPDAQVGEPYDQPVTTAGGKSPITIVGPTSLPPGLSWSGTALTGTPTEAGSATLSFEATDGNGRSLTASFALTITGSLSVSGAAVPTGVVGAPYTFQFTASGGVAPYSFEVSEGTLPAGLALSTEGAVSGTPLSVAHSTFTVRVTDAAGEEGARTVTLAVVPALTLVAATVPPAYAGSSYSFQFEASGGSPPYTFEVSSGTLPSGLSLSGEGELGGTPGVAVERTVTLRVEDADGTQAQRSFNLEVLAALTVSTSALPDGYRTQGYALTLTATGGEGPYTFEVTSGTLFGGLSLSAAGVLGGTPSEAGAARTLELTVTDAHGVTATRALGLAVYEPPVVGAGDPPDAYVGTPVSHQAEVTGGKAPITWSLGTGSLPAWATFSSTGALTGTPTGPGSYSAEVIATDDNDVSGARTVSLTVYALPEITSSTLAGASLGNSYLQQVATTGGKAPLTFTVLSGALPAGITLDEETGLLSGTPTELGLASFTIELGDANGRTDSQLLEIDVGDAAASAPLAIANWNIEWFGDSGKTPEDATQLDNAITVMTEVDADIWGLGEIVSTTQFDTLVDALPGYAGFVASDVSVSGGSSNYHSAEQKPAFVYRTSKVEVLGSEVILTSLDFAGRPPLKVDARVSVTDSTVDITFIVVHLKAFQGQEEHDRRKAAVEAIKSYIDTNLPAANVMVLGDFNDDVDEGITSDGLGGFLDTPFRAVVDDTANYRFVTTPLSEAGLRSTVSHDNIVDHQLATNELNALFTGPVEVVRPDLWATPVPSYGSSTSDHYPVLSHFDLSGAGGGDPDPDPGYPVFLNEILFDEPFGPVPGGGSGSQFFEEFVEVVNGGTEAFDLSGWTITDATGHTSAFARHVFAAGTILQPGEAIVVLGGSEASGASLPNAVIASTDDLNLHPADEVRLKAPDGSTVDSYSWTSNWGDGISANRSPDGSSAGSWVQHTTLDASLSSAGVRVDGTAW